MPLNEMRDALDYLVSGYRKRLLTEGPLFVTWFVTSICNARCVHCFYWRNLNSHRDDLSLEEVEKISKSMPEFRNLLLSGGEPFLRKDLDDFCKIILHQNKVKLLTIPTNAIPVKKVVDKATSIARDCPETRIFIQISIDGLRETHDDIRKYPGAFDRLVETYWGIRESQKSYPNLQPTFCYAFMQQNQDQAIPTFEYLREKLDADNINVNLIRGDALEGQCKEVQVEKYRDAVEYLINELSPAPENQNLFKKIYWTRHTADYRHIYQTIKTGDFIAPCQAGYLNAVIDERGKVYPCEILGHPIGDLRAEGYDFRRIWRGHQAEQLRRRIREERCTCTHETNASINTSFNLPMLLKSFLPGSAEWGPRDGGGAAAQRGELLGQELAGQTPWWRDQEDPAAK